MALSADDALTGNMAIQTNRMTRAYAQRFFDEFCNLFEISGNGSLRATREKLLALQEWWNRTYLLISLITGIPLVEVLFDVSIQRRGAIAVTNANKIKLLQLFGVSYAVLLRMAATLNTPIPVQFSSAMTLGNVIIDDADEEIDETPPNRRIVHNIEPHEEKMEPDA